MSGSVETIGEEKAKKVLTTVDFLSKLREEIVSQPELRERLEQRAELALDLPEWWIPGKHDHDLVIGAARSVAVCLQCLHALHSVKLKTVVLKINSFPFFISDNM